MMHISRPRHKHLIFKKKRKVTASFYAFLAQICANTTHVLNLLQSRYALIIIQRRMLIAAYVAQNMIQAHGHFWCKV